LQQLKLDEEVMQVVNQPKTKVLGKAKHFGVVPLGPALVAPAGVHPPSPLEMNTGGKPSTVGGRGPITRTHHSHTQQLAHRQQSGLHNRVDGLSQTSALPLSKPACWNLGQQTSSEFRVSDQLLFAPRPKINLDNEQQLNSQNPLVFTHEPPHMAQKAMAQKAKRRGSLVGVLPTRTKNGGKTYKNAADLPQQFLREVTEQEDGDLWLLRGCVTVLQLLDAVGQRSAVSSNLGGKKLLALAAELPKMRQALQKKAQVKVQREQSREKIGQDGTKGSEQSTAAATEARLEMRAAMLQAMSENQRAEAMMLEKQQAEVMLENQRQRELLAAQLEAVSESQRQARQQREALADQLSKDDGKQDGIDQLMQKNAEDEFEREQLLHMQQMKEAQLEELILLGAESEALLEATIQELAAQDEQGSITGEPKMARSWISEEGSPDILPQADWFDDQQLEELLNELTKQHLAGYITKQDFEDCIAYLGIAIEDTADEPIVSEVVSPPPAAPEAPEAIVAPLPPPAKLEEQPIAEPVYIPTAATYAQRMHEPEYVSLETHEAKPEYESPYRQRDGLRIRYGERPVGYGKIHRYRPRRKSLEDCLKASARAAEACDAVDTGEVTGGGSPA